MEQKIVASPGRCPCTADCESRFPGCHSKCKDYVEWLSRKHEYDEVVRQFRNLDTLLNRSYTKRR